MFLIFVCFVILSYGPLCIFRDFQLGPSASNSSDVDNELSAFSLVLVSSFPITTIHTLPVGFS